MTKSRKCTLSKSYIRLQGVDVLLSLLHLELVVVDDLLRLPVGLLGREGRPLELGVAVDLLLEVELEPADGVLEVIALVRQPLDPHVEWAGAEAGEDPGRLRGHDGPRPLLLLVLVDRGVVVRLLLADQDHAPLRQESRLLVQLGL